MVIPFYVEHLDALDMPAAYRELAKAGRATMETLAHDALAVTIVSRDSREVLAVLGAVTYPVAGECEVFIFPSAVLRQQAVTFWRDLRQEIERMKARFARIRAIGADTELARRFLSRLGFQLKGAAMRPGCEGKLMWVMEGNS